MTTTNFQGDKASQMFRGKGQSSAAQLFYAESADLFADAIKKNLKPGKYSLVDLGGHKGEFLGEVLAKLSEYDFDSLVIDVVDGVDAGLKAKKIKGDIRNTGLTDKSVDIVIMRYVLSWNLFEDQKSVLEEISRICRGICVIQHQGANNENPKLLQTASAKIFSGSIIPRLKRDKGFFTESGQVEKWLNELGIDYEKIQERTVETLSETFIEKFALTSEEARNLKETLSGCDYINQSAFVLNFSK